MPSHPDRVRKNYKPDNNYPPCKYTTHIFNDSLICIWCDKTKFEIMEEIEKSREKLKAIFKL